MRSKLDSSSRSLLIAVNSVMMLMMSEVLFGVMIMRMRMMVMIQCLGGGRRLDVVVPGGDVAIGIVDHLCCCRCRTGCGKFDKCATTGVSVFVVVVNSRRRLIAAHHRRIG
jgi:hypothetical protein